MRRLFILLALMCSLTANGENLPLTYERISLSVSAGEEVENDTLIATLFSQKEGNNPAQLATQVNQDMQKAIAAATHYTSVKLQTLDYTTNPIYRNNTLSGWRVRQSIQLESQDPVAISELIGKLQASLSVASTHYTVSPAKRERVEEGLIAQAIQSFKARAELITHEMSSQGYRLVHMDINSSRSAPRSYAMQGMALRAEAAPSLEAGTQRVEVHISGSIELQIK
ncbi:SIMPL domain-containing protein [Sedimenticola selenatireducens]|nr:SIMPL domain-containing protein [Sedimenticola selenatireducens]